MTMNKSQGQPGDNQRSDFSSASIPNLVDFAFTEVQPPSPLYIQRDDVVFINWMSSEAAETITIGMRLLTPSVPSKHSQPDSREALRSNSSEIAGTVVPIFRSFAMAAQYTVQTDIITGTEGFLLSVTAAASTASSRGQTFVKVGILRGSATFTNTLYGLFADYITNGCGQGWPNGRFISPVEGPGALRTVLVTSPAAGADFTYTPQALTRVRVQSLQATLTTSAAVANRQVRVRISDPAGNFVYSAVAAVSIAASLTAFVSVAPGQPQSALIATEVGIALPQPCYLGRAGYTVGSIQIQTLNLQGADTWTAIKVMIEEWLDV